LRKQENSAAGKKDEYAEGVH